MAERRNPADWANDHLVSDDGIPTRPSGSWARDKLGIIAMYASQFTSASKRAGRTYFVDGLAGPGICYVAERNEYIRGSSLIALQAEPPFSKCLAMDLNLRHVEALRQRTSDIPGRIVVQQGDVNRDLVPLMEREIEDRRAPILVLLDPEGFELDWATVTALSKFRAGERKAELLILAMSSSIERVAGRYDPATEVTRLDWALPPGPGWRSVHDQYRSGQLSPEEARQANAALYEKALREDLGYEFAISRAITRTRGRDGASYYHLVFASDHPAGERIMRYAFDTVYTNPRTYKSGPPPRQEGPRLEGF